MLRRFLFTLLALGALLLASSPVLAAWPEKPIRLIVPSAPGGAPDALMRALGQQLSLQLGVPVVIDNKPGGSYVIGTLDLVKSAPRRLYAGLRQHRFAGDQQVAAAGRSL